MSSIQSVVAEYTAARTKMVEALTATLNESFKPFFEANPEIRSIEWTQYTPYFMDGDPCDFGRNDFYYSLRPELYADESTREQIEEGDYSVYDLEEMSYDANLVDGVDRERIEKAFNAFTKELSQIPDEVFEEAFGDHCRVTVTTDGITVDEYDHD